MMVDGLFVEVKEMIGGFFLLNVEMCEEVLVIVVCCLVVEWVMIEVCGVGFCYED